MTTTSASSRGLRDRCLQLEGASRRARPSPRRGAGSAVFADDQGHLGAALGRDGRRGRSPACPSCGCRGSAPGRAARGCLRPRRRPDALRGRSRCAAPCGMPPRPDCGPPPERWWARIRSHTAYSSSGSGSRPGPVSRAGEPARCGRDDVHAALGERGDVGLGGGVVPHLGVHGRGHDHRAAGGEQHVGEQVVGHGRSRPARAGRRWPGATTTRSAPCPSRTCGTSWTDVQTSVCTGLPDSADQVGAPTNCRADAVGTTVTSWPASVNRRSSEQAL